MVLIGVLFYLGLDDHFLLFLVYGVRIWWILMVLPPLVVTDFEFSRVGSGCPRIPPNSEEGKEAAT
jgi:hypothetical protein